MSPGLNAKNIDPDELNGRREQAVTMEAVASFDGSGDARLREVMQSLVRHLHAFVRETRLTEDEWNAGVAFLTDAGHITTDTRQEFVLLSDVLGVSMLTVAVNEPGGGNETESTVFGPFFVQNSPESHSAATLPAALAVSPAGSAER